MVWGNHENILPGNLFTYVKKIEDYERDLVCSWVSCVSGHLRLVGKRTSLCQRDLWGSSNCMRFVFLFSLSYLDVLLRQRLHFLILPEQLLELVLQMKVSLSTLLQYCNRAILAALSCLRGHIV